MVSICNQKLNSGMGVLYLCSIPNLCNIPKMIRNLYQVYESESLIVSRDGMLSDRHIQFANQTSISVIRD